MKLSEILSDESKWTKETNAKNAQGQKVDPRSPTATCFCLNGALLLHESTNKHSSMRKLIHEKIGNSIPRYNDNPKIDFSDIQKLIEVVEKEAEGL